MHQSIATIDSPEFINLQPLDINPLMSSCEIKVLYLGENRNHSYISKEVATEMAKTLRGAPIVGYYKESTQDFGDHGERVIFDDEGIKFECLTKPYGFVAPDAKVWFQKFEDTDDFGNRIEREYLMTTGFLWTEQYEECKVAVEEGRPHSMELDENTLDGHWSTNNKTGMDFFIINDAIFSKLCILGEDVEPCFEGSTVEAPKVSSSFSLVNDEFKQTLYTMMQELKFALEGGQNMEEENVIVNDVQPEVETEVVETPVEKTEKPVEKKVHVGPNEPCPCGSGLKYKMPIFGKLIYSLDFTRFIKAMLLDLNMPKVDGFAVLEYMKKNDLFDKIPVSIISGDSSRETIQKAFTYPIVDMLEKPFNEQTIRTVLQKTLWSKELN